jgi:Family of unknown function (DUF6311)
VQGGVSGGIRAGRLVRRIVFAELPTWQLLILAAVVGIAWAATMFDGRFVAGTNPFWQFPAGTIPNAKYDMAQVLVAYFYFAQAPWHIPLFDVAALGTPTGANIIMMDAVPFVALIGKLIAGAAGTLINPYGAYLFLCFVLPGVMMTLVLVAARIRSALAVIIGAIFANAMPAMLLQWGHIALQAHFLLIGALALYLFSLRERSQSRLAAGWILYLSLAYLTNMYLFVMPGVVWLAAVVQRCIDGLTTPWLAVRHGLLVVAAVLIVIALGGQFGAGGGLPFGEYGRYSMNLLSPFVPQESGWLPQFRGVIDATGAQYEGFNYLGIGLLFASLLLLPAELGWIRRNARRHLALLIALACLAAYAISHRVYAGERLLFEVPLPYALNRVLGVFRSSGRFFWLIGYVQLAMVVVLAFRRANPAIVLCLALAAILQIVDVQPLRAQIAAGIAAGPSPGPFPRDEVARLLVGARHLDVIPSFQCSGELDRTSRSRQEQANMEWMLAAARADVPTNSVYLGRQTYGLTLRDVLRAPTRGSELLDERRAAYCRDESDRARGSLSHGDIRVMLAEQPTPQELPPDLTCSALSWARICKRSKD